MIMLPTHEPVHNHPYFSSSRRGDMSVTDRVTGEVMTVPLTASSQNTMWHVEHARCQANPP